jgi:hypothetical protein
MICNPLVASHGRCRVEEGFRVTFRFNGTETCIVGAIKWPLPIRILPVRPLYMIISRYIQIRELKIPQPYLIEIVTCIMLKVLQLRDPDIRHPMLICDHSRQGTEPFHGLKLGENCINLEGSDSTSNVEALTK